MSLSIHIILLMYSSWTHINSYGFVLIHNCSSLSGEQAGRVVFEALRAGRDAITPGIVNKLYRYGLSPVLPAPVRATLAQVGVFNSIRSNTLQKYPSRLQKYPFQIALTPLPQWPPTSSAMSRKSTVFGYNLLSSLLQLDVNGTSGGARVSAHTYVAIATSLLTQHLNSPIR